MRGCKKAGFRSRSNVPATFGVASRLCARVTFGVVSVALLATVDAAPLTTAFTYQGQVKSDGSPITGNVDIEFSLWNAATLGAQSGATVTKLNVAATNGLFTTELNFGANAFEGEDRWLQLAVRYPAGGGAYVPLTDRQHLTATPNSLFSLRAANTFWQAFGTNITNTNSGFVGVNRLTAVNASEYFGIQAQATGTSYGGMYIRTDSATAKPYYGYAAGSEAAWTYLNGATGHWHVYNGAERLTVTGAGNVGIGVNDPTFRLQVEGNNASDILHVEQNGSGRAAQLYVPNGASGLPLYAVTYGTGRAASFESHTSNTNPTVQMFKNGETVLRLIGGVNAGDPALDATLAILGGTDSEPSGGGFIVAGSVSGLNISLDNNEIMARNNGAAAALSLNNDGGNIHLLATGTGGVSIGTTTIPTGVLLAVDGKVLCEELEVQLSGDWPDFVFDDDYSLTPLTELEAKIRADKHLPGIPSAKDVEAKGINVGDMQSKLLQKVEELTLYTIELNKQLDLLKRQNDALSARVNQMEGAR